MDITKMADCIHSTLTNEKVHLPVEVTYLTAEDRAKIIDAFTYLAFLVHQEELTREQAIIYGSASLDGFKKIIKDVHTFAAQCIDYGLASQRVRNDIITAMEELPTQIQN
jgi:hypothetical protein